MSTALQASEEAASSLRQRGCKRTACSTAPPLTATGEKSNCCEGDCLVEVARRDCNKECGPKPVEARDGTKSCQTSEFSKSTAGYTRSGNTPCARHYKKTRDQYGAILDNLGCICKILLSLDIESCCVIPSHASIRSQRSSLSEKSAIAKNLRKESSDPGKSTMSMEIEKGDDCSKKGCCAGNSDSSMVISKATCGTSSPQMDDCSKKSCCSNKIPKPDTNVTVATVAECCSSTKVKEEPILSSECSKKSCCDKKSLKPTESFSVAKSDGCCGNTKLKEKPALSSTVFMDDCSKKSCCGGKKPKPVPNFAVANVDNCCSGGQSTEKAITPPVVSAKDCSKKSCCSQKNVPLTSKLAVTKGGGCCSSANLGEKSIEPCVEDIASSSISNVDNIDIENGLFEVEHLVLSVHGMTCTGCEKKLYRSLDSLPAVSNIKTSLVLAQAEFDLNISASFQNGDIIKTLEKMTGFTCMRMVQSGEELDLIVSGNAQDYASVDDLPAGVTDLTILINNVIRLTYHPKIIGARELLSDPFFRSAKLAPAAARPLIASGRAHVRMSLFMTLLSAILTIPVLVLAWAPLPKHEILYGAISLGLATVVQVVIAGPFYSGALKALIFSRMIEMDLLIVLSTTTAYVYSVIAYSYLAAGKPLSTGEFFETSTLLVTLIMVGRTVSAFARQRAVESISIESLQTPSALLVDPKTHQSEEIDARLLQYRDTFKVLPDTTVVTDGIVITGETEVDESMITGEATLVVKKPGMSVIAGSLNHSGTLVVKLTRLPGENTIKTIGAMVDEAKSSKPRIQEIADRVASYFVPFILVITLIVFVIWVGVGKGVRHQSTTTTCIVAMTYAISALIVSCPCAIGLAVPMVVVIAGGVAAKYGLIFKTAETIEIARSISHVIFDKTGTLTQGKLSVVVEEYPTKESDLLRPMILGLTANSKHPVSTAIAASLKHLEVEPSRVENVVSIAGAGIEATFHKSTIRSGNPHWLGFETHPSVQKILSLGLTTFCVSRDNTLIAVFGLKDTLRPDALEVITQLKKRSIKISLVSGDNEEAVLSVAKQLDIPIQNVRSHCTPADKQAYVKSLLAPSPTTSKSKTSTPIIAFIGDGTNDAPSLAQASIGIHINEGTDIAQSAADAVLMRPSLRGILILIDLSKAFHRRVVFNFTWSFIYNIFAILLAAGAFPHARIPPQYAGLGEIVSVLPVIAVAMQLKWARFQGKK
ncbi:E1-E2 ATPase-domain-containing protein [Halenospora varia]|nr:E1-E2 ATPase-domain-containing protein [Halenospora varia]